MVSLETTLFIPLDKEEKDIRIWWTRICLVFVQLIVRYLKKSRFWYDQIQFLTRDVAKDRMAKYSKDPKYAIFRNATSVSDFSIESIQTANSIIDAHVGLGRRHINHKSHKGDWMLLRKILGLVIQSKDVRSWHFIDKYWRNFKSNVENPSSFN